MSRALVCSICKMRQENWGSKEGFIIEDKVYCCIGCGFSGCTCVETPQARRQRSQISLTGRPE